MTKTIQSGKMVIGWVDCMRNSEFESWGHIHSFDKKRRRTIHELRIEISL